MKIKLLSDVHLEFGDFHPGSGDVLVLAGDVCVAQSLVEGGPMRDRYLTFFQQCVANYNKVFYVMGNHEQYHGDFDATLNILRGNIDDRISLLHNQVEVYEGVNFVGATLWTSMNNMDNDTMDMAENGMNDYRQVTRHGRLMNPMDTVESNIATREFITKTLPLLEGEIFMITHHAPSKQSVRGRYTDQAGAYANDLEVLIQSFPQVKNWVHGHIHHNNDYMVGGCRVVSNPRGYHDYEVNPDFDPNFEIDIATPVLSTWKF